MKGRSIAELLSLGQFAEGGGMVTLTDAGTSRWTVDQQAAAQPPFAALEKEEEEGKHCCLATGGSRVISLS